MKAIGALERLTPVGAAMMESAGRAHTLCMSGVVIGIAVGLVAVFWAVIIVVMIRASNAQRARVKRTDFGGRYTFSGFVLGLLRDNEPPPHSRKTKGHASGSEGAGRSSH